MEDDKFNYHIGLGKALVAACFEYYTGKIKLKEIETNYQTYAAILIKDLSGVGFQKLCSQINMDKRSLDRVLSNNKTFSNNRDKPLKYCFKYMEGLGGGYGLLGEFIDVRTQAKDSIETIIKEIHFVEEL